MKSKPITKKIKVNKHKFTIEIYPALVDWEIFPIQPYEFISKNDLSFFQGNVVKYVCRYQRKGGAEDIKKIIHYCQLELKKMRDIKNEK